MILISHRGNINGKNESLENEPGYITSAISEGYDVEIDIWFKDGKLFLGHDEPQYNIDLTWLHDRISELWVHCKNIEAAELLKKTNYGFNYFFHNTDDMVLTSNGYFWTYPGKILTKNSIAVLPEQVNYTKEEINLSYGVCSDYILNYK